MNFVPEKAVVNFAIDPIAKFILRVIMSTDENGESIEQQLSRIVKEQEKLRRENQILKAKIDQAVQSANSDSEKSPVDCPPTSEPKVVKKKGGRPRKYEQSLLSSEDIVGLSPKQVAEKARTLAMKMENSLNNFLDKVDGAILKTQIVYDHQISLIAGQNLWYVHIANPVPSIPADVYDFGDLKAATDYYNEIPKDHSEGIFHRVALVRDYLVLAREFKAKEHYSLHDIARIPKRMGFLMAYDWETGGIYSIEDRTRTCQALRNVKLWESSREAGVSNPTAWIRANIIEPLFRPLRGDTITKSYYEKKIDIVRRSLDKFVSKFGPYAKDVKAILDTLNDVQKEFVRDASFDKEDNYPALPLSDVEIVLHEAAKLDIRFYNYLILQLSTCLRNEEVERLSKDYLRPDNLLEYQYAKNGVFLIQKTTRSGKVDPLKLNNPQTSIATRIILKHMEFCYPHSARTFFDSQKSKVRKLLQTEEGHQRSLRTTGATFLRYGLATRICRPIDPRWIQYRMAHINEQMVITVYANSAPADARGVDCDEYFKIGPIEIRGHEVNQGEFLWDLWLLRHMLRTYKDFSTRKYESLLNHIEAELVGRVTPVFEKEVF